MSSLAQAVELNTESEPVTTISANARVDYILRFSKHAVMVVDEQISLCSSVGSQYLSNLSPDQNAAYITMSAKLNDLQVRCRIIEQLFGNILFDPEQSVAVSVINLAKKNQQAVSIVIDNAHLLSLQLTHELCQLAEIAKKSNYHINVLMLATPLIGTKVSQNLSLFHKKLSIISAVNGQLIPHQSPLFSPSMNLFSLTPFKKWALFFLCFSSALLMVVFMLMKQDTFTFTKNLFNASGNQLPEPVTLVVEKESFVSDVVAGLEKKPDTLATSLDVFQALVMKKHTQSEPNNIAESTLLTDQKAEQLPRVDDIRKEDILAKIAETKKQIKEASLRVEARKAAIAEQKKQLPVIENPAPVVKVDAILGSNYYLEKNAGFVIQIVGFTQQHMLQDFLSEYESLNLRQYNRLVNDEAITMITSAHFQTREQAEIALSLLPEEIKARSPWIKSITAINNEINSFQRSQSKENNVTIAS